MGRIQNAENPTTPQYEEETAAPTSPYYEKPARSAPPYYEQPAPQYHEGPAAQYHEQPPPQYHEQPAPRYQEQPPLSAPPYHDGNENSAQAPPLGNPWSSGLFDCHENQTNAVMTGFLPCVTFGQIAEVLDEGQMTCPLGSTIYALMMAAVCSHWVVGSRYRTKLRLQYGLVEAPYSDIISHVFCPFCSLCQEFRELQKRNLDPTLGWNGILAQHGSQHRYQSNVPPTPQRMNM